ncbi:MAG: TcpQ domain-containing protein [Burkholderiales bacterium]|nr:TcpQ domain-containing protein [Burkholderiales bacterium]
MKPGITTSLVLGMCVWAGSTNAQITNATREAAASSVNSSAARTPAPIASAVATGTADGVVIVDKPFEAPRVEPKLPLQPPAPALPIAAPARPASAVAAAAVPAPAPAAPEWKIQASDGFLSRSLRRWERDAKFPILWEASKDLPAITAVYRSDFLGALKLLMEDTRFSEYPLHACAHDNVVRILHTSQSCTR